MIYFRKEENKKDQQQSANLHTKQLSYELLNDNMSISGKDKQVITIEVAKVNDKNIIIICC